MVKSGRWLDKGIVYAWQEDDALDMVLQHSHRDKKIRKILIIKYYKFKKVVRGAQTYARHAILSASLQ